MDTPCDRLWRWFWSWLEGQVSEPHGPLQRPWYDGHDPNP